MTASITASGARPLRRLTNHGLKRSSRKSSPSSWASSATSLAARAQSSSRTRGADGDPVEVVKRERRDVIITGSLSVVHALMAEDLIDEYRLLTFPTILGTGKRLFPDGGTPVHLECLSADRPGAAVLARYGRASR